MKKLEALTAMQRDRVRSKHEKLVFAVLLSYADDAGTCWPGLDVLSADTGLARSTVIAAIHGLGRERAGALVGLRLIRRGGLCGGRGGRVSNLYELWSAHIAPAKTTRRPLESAGQTQPPRLSPPGDQLSPPGGRLESAPRTRSGSGIKITDQTRARARETEALSTGELTTACLRVAAAAKQGREALANELRIRVPGRPGGPEPEARGPVRAEASQAPTTARSPARDTG